MEGNFASFDLGAPSSQPEPPAIGIGTPQNPQHVQPVTSTKLTEFPLRNLVEICAGRCECVFSPAE